MAEQVPEDGEHDDGAEAASAQFFGPPTCRHTSQKLTHDAPLSSRRATRAKHEMRCASCQHRVDSPLRDRSLRIQRGDGCGMAPGISGALVGGAGGWPGGGMLFVRGCGVAPLAGGMLLDVAGR